VPTSPAFVFALVGAGLSAAAIKRPFKDDEAPR
jgi:hypothetical protein